VGFTAIDVALWEEEECGRRRRRRRGRHRKWQSRSTFYEAVAAAVATCHMATM